MARRWECHVEKNGAFRLDPLVLKQRLPAGKDSLILKGGATYKRVLGKIRKGGVKPSLTRQEKRIRGPSGRGVIPMSMKAFRISRAHIGKL